MKPPECILVRTGEIYLKSEQVQRIFMRILLNNISSGLSDGGVDFKIEALPHRIFIFTKEIEKSTEILKMIFGITSLSPVWMCEPTISEMRKCAGYVGSEILKINKGDSFAIRARRAGSHAFNSQDIGREAGDEVNILTKARIDLTNPKHEIFVECRQRQAYVYTDSTAGPGGLPLGTAGRIIAVLDDMKSVVAAWMMMRKGCQIIAAYRKKEHLDIIKKWHIGKKLESYKLGKIDNIIKKSNTYIICTSKEEFAKKDVLVLNPVMALDDEKIKNLSKTIEQFVTTK